jgi:hypothetical protein
MHHAPEDNQNNLRVAYRHTHSARTLQVNVINLEPTIYEQWQSVFQQWLFHALQGFMLFAYMTIVL